MLADLRFAVRLLLKAPAFSIAILLTLALGIGANTAIFTVVNTVLLHPLPYPQSDRIVTISRQGELYGNVSVPMFTFFRQNNPGFEDLSAYQPGTSVSLNLGDRAESVEASKVSQNYFLLCGATPILGRAFTPMEDEPGGPPVAMLSHRLWKSTFNGDPSIVGRVITLAGAPFTVVGVLSESFHSYPAADIWTPLQADAASTVAAHVLTVAGRLPPGLTMSEANARAAVVSSRYAQTHSGQVGDDDRLQVTTMQRQITGDVRASLLTLLGAVGLVLLIACANVANLLLSRAATRRRELAIRTAIGASRGRIIRQLLSESLLLALGGGVLGLMFGSWGIHAVLAFTSAGLPRIQEMAAVPALDPSVAVFTLVLSVVTGILFGLFPAVKLSRSTALAPQLKQQRRPHSILMASEMAIAVVLLCSAALLIRSFVKLHEVPLGFDARNLISVELSLDDSHYSKSSDVDRLASRLAAAALDIPGIESAAVAGAAPLFGEVDMIFGIPGRPLDAGRKFHGDVQWRFITPQYFETLKTRLISGRFLAEREPRPAVIINQAMARKFWPDRDPVGQSIDIGQGLGRGFEQGLTEIVGVVADERVRLGFDSVEMMYQVPSQVSDASMQIMNRIQRAAILVRTRPGVSAGDITSALEREVFSIAGLPIGKMRTIAEARYDSTARENFNVLLLAMFAGVATLLAATGVYGVIAYSVAQRTREMGIRAALGATQSGIVRFILAQALRIISAGTAVGMIASFWITPLLRAQLYGVQPLDPFSFTIVPLVLILVATAAAYIPAARAGRVDVIVALRQHD